MTTISSKTILRSRNLARPDKIASTLLLRYPRCIHSEFMTHRVFSRNAASSRAIPVSKLIQDVLDDPFVPLFWGKNQKGMQAGAECNEPVQLYEEQQGPGERDSDYYDFTREAAWLKARDNAVEMARAFADVGYHKQIVNRLLEPFAHITVVVTATEWANFLALRDHPDAEPHIQVLAREVAKCLENDPIQDLNPGEWHLPFIMPEDVRRLNLDYRVADLNEKMGLLRKLSVARCASTSYKTVDGFDMTLDRAIELHNKLVASSPLHASPAEHQAFADVFDSERGIWGEPHLHGNFEGFAQYRKTLPNEFVPG